MPSQLVACKGKKKKEIKHYVMKAYGGVDDIDPPFLHLGTGWR
jgi:hypothetical protein